MGRPTVRNFPNDSFCFGPQVQANDAAVMAELQGNCAKNININDYKTKHSLSASVRWLWLETSIGPVGPTNDGSGQVMLTESAIRNGVIWQYRSERACTVLQSYLQFYDNFETGAGYEIKIGLFKSKTVPKFDSGNGPTDFDSFGDKLSGDTFEFETTGGWVQASPTTPLNELTNVNKSLAKDEYLFVAAQVVWPPQILAEGGGGTTETAYSNLYGVASRMRLHVQVTLQEEHL
tara:strand:- start:853 stop:1554 length:702 start_codon:yes stop_codon:yes gene_type:complete